jgi:methionyl aminopeptidase
VTTAELDRIAASETKARGARPAFLGYRGYPATLCVSVNEEVVHGIPSPRKALKPGDLVSLDFGVVLSGFFADAAVTVGVGKVSPQAQALLDATREALAKGIDQMQPDRRIGDISAAVQQHAESKGFSVVRSFVGHGIGRALHEDPPVPNFGKAGTGLRLAPGMVLAVEPMVNAGGYDVRVLEDGWTAVTRDGKWSAHFEHTIAVTADGPEILTVER